MVLESILTDLLNKYLGDYVENLDKKQLKVGIWGGDVVLENLSLRESAFDDLDLPIQLVYGYLGKLVLKIPWKNLYSQPVVAQVEDLYILLSPKQSIRYDPKKEAKYEMQAKQAALQDLETRRKFEEEKNKLKGDPTFAEKLTAQIVNNLQIKIANVHIRYEDNTTTNHPLAFGITLHGLEVFTTDAFWERSYMSGQTSKVYKIADLDSLAGYMNCNARIFMQYDLSEFSNLFKSNIAYKGYFPKNYSYIFGPISIITKLKLNMNPERDEPPFLTPKIDLVLGMETLNIGITRIQFQDVLTLCDSLNRLQAGVKFRKYRPYSTPYKNNAKVWWKFAMTCILEEDVRRRARNFSWDHIKQHRKLCKTYAESYKEKMLSKKPSANLIETVELCEKKLDIFNLILIRNRVYLELDALKMEEQLKSQKSSWFGWWGGTKEETERSEFAKKFAEAMTPEEKAKLYKAIGYQENVQQLQLPETYAAIKMKFSLASLEVGVNDEIVKSGNTERAEDVVGSRSIVHLKLSWVICDVSQRPSSNGLTVKMGIKNMLLTGYKQKDFVPTIIKSIVFDEENLLDINFEINPIDKKCDQKIKVFARPLQIAYDAKTVIQIVQVFTAPSTVNVSNLTPAVNMPDVKERSALGFQYLVESHPKLEVDVKFLPSIVIVPHSGIYKGDNTPVIVLSLGQLIVETDPHKGDDDVREMFKVGTGKETILKEMMERTYDKFKISVENIQVIVAKANENWTEILKTGELSEMHILCPTVLSVTVGLCLIDDDPRLPKKRVKVVIPSVKINVIEERIFEGLDIAASIPLPESETEDKGLIKSASFALSTMSLKKLLETERESAKKNASAFNPEVPAEVVQYVDLDIKFALKEFAVILYKAREDKDTTPSDQYKTPVEEFELDIFQNNREIHVDPSGHDKLITFQVIQLEAQMVQRTYDMKASVKLGAIALNQYDRIVGKEEHLTIINTPQYEKDVKYLLTISYTNANKTAPEFKTKYNSTEQLIVVKFSSLLVVLHQEFLKKLLSIANSYQIKLNEIQSLKPRDHYASAAEEGLLPKIKENLTTILEEETDEKIIKKPERVRRKAKVVDSIKIKVVANMEQVAVELTCHKRPIANLQVSNFNAGVVIKTSYTEITLRLKDILVTDLNPETIHPKALSIIGENALQCQVVIYNLDETANYNSDDMKIDVTMGCVKIIFLNWFVQSCLSFLNNFQAAQQALANASAAAADAAKQNVVDAYEKATRLKFNVKIKAPIIIVPVNSKSTEGIALDLGFLSITNMSSEIKLKQLIADKNKRGPAVVDEIKLELKDLKLSRVTISPPHDTATVSKDIEDSNRTYGLTSIVNIFDPISFALIVIRNLSYSWYKEKPELDVSGRIKSIELNILVEDYVLLMSILNKNLPEGQHEFPPISHSKKADGDVQEAVESPVTKVEVHQGGGDAPTEEVKKNVRNSAPDDIMKAITEARAAALKMTSEAADLPASADLQKAIDKKKVDIALKFSFQLDGIIVNLITVNKEGLASFGIYVLSVKGKQLADGTLSTSIVLCDLQLDDIRPTSKTKINKYLQRREKKKRSGVSETEENIPYMVDAVAIIKNKETFAELRVCAFDLIISIDFLMQIANFITLPAEEEGLHLAVKSEVKPSSKSHPIKKKQSASDPNQKLDLILHLEQPDIILIENLDDFNTHAIIFNSEVNLRFRMIGDKQLIYGDIKDLKMYMCSFLPERREATKHFIIYPCTMTLQGSTPDNEGLHVNLKSSEIIINISPATIELINKAVMTVFGSTAEKIAKSKPPADYSHIWTVKDFKEDDHWFMKIEEGYDALDLDQDSLVEVQFKPEVCIVELPAIIIVLESGVGYYTTPLLTVETNLNAAVHDWSKKMRINGNLTLTISYYNDSLAVWEPLIEPNERVGKTTGVSMHSPWEMNFELITEAKQSDEDINVEESMTKIKIHSVDVLEITISKTCYDLLMELGTAFSQAFDPQGLVKPDVVAPYVLENDTGFELSIDFTKGIFTLHDYHIPSLNPKYTDSVNSALVFQAMEEEPDIKPEDVKNCKVSSNGKVYLKKKALVDMDVPSSTSNLADDKGGSTQEYLNIQIGGIKKQISIPVSKTDERYFPLYRDTNQEPWGIISQVSTEYGTTKINIHGVLKIRNHFTTTITIYRYRNEKIQFVGDVRPGEDFHVPLHAIYSSHKELYFSLPGYKRSVQGIKWNECLTDLSYSRQIQCDPVSTYEPFYINALREKTEVFFEVTSKFTLLSASYTIHLRPPLYLRNALPIEIKVSVAGCSVRQDGLAKGVEVEEEVSVKNLAREDFLDYGEKEIKPGDVLHLPTVKLTTKSGEAKSYIVVRLIQYLEKDWSCTTEISETHQDYELWTFSSYDSVSKMDMELGVKYENRHGSLMLTLYCPFWMINKTGLTLSYRPNAESVNVLYHPPNYEGPILFSCRDKYFFGKKRASIRVDSGEWSDKIPLDVAGSTGSVQCNANDTVYTIGVHNHLTYNSLTKEITFIPFYIVINKAYFPIEVQEANRPGDPWLKVEAGECVPLWPKTDTKHILHVRIPDERHVSPPFKYTEVQCTLLKMKNKYGGINVDVHVTEGGIFITFTEYHPGDAPGLIINHTSKKISFWEKGNINERILQPFQQLLFSWADAAGHRKILWDNGKDRIENDLRRDGFGPFQLGHSENDTAYWVSFLNGTQRVLLFTERASVVAQAESSANLVKLTQEIEVSIHGIGLSIINNIKGVDILYVGITSSGIIWESRKRGKKRFKQMKIAQNAMIEHKFQEFLNDQEVGELTKEYFIEGEKFRVDFYEMKLKKNPEREIRRTHYPGVWLQLKTSDFQTQLHAKINRIQIDNQLLDCIFPVVLAPIPPPKSVAASTALKPFIECSVVERIVPYSTVKQYKYATILMQEFHVKVDLQFISAISEIFAKEISDEEAAKLFNLDLNSIVLPLSDMVASQSKQEQKNFYDNLHLGPLKIHVSFSMAGSDVTALPTIMSTILQSVGVTLTDVNDVVFRLAFFEREYRFLTHNQLISEISAHYTGQFLKQVYVLVFGLDVLGNPYGLVVGISKGIEDLFYEPFQGAIQGPGEFAEGLALGVKSLFGHAVGGAAGAFSKITGAMGKGIAALTFDKEYQRKRRAALHKKPTNFQEGIARNSKGLVMGFVDGVTGVFTKPISGAKEQGFEGFFKGLGKGAVGLVARPTAGVVDFASGTLDTVKRAAESTEDVLRMRPARFLHADGVVRPYTRSEAEGNKILRELEKGKYAKTDVFEHYEEIVEKQEVLVLSNHRVIYAIKSDLFGNWVIQWTNRWNEIGMIRSMDKGVEITLKREDKKMLGIFSSAEAHRKVLFIPQKARRDLLAYRMETLRLRAE